MTDSDEEDTWSKGSGDDGSSESVCDDDVEVVDIYTSVESFCVCRTGTNKTQSGHDLKTPSSFQDDQTGRRGEVRLSDAVSGLSCVSCVHT